MAVTISPSGNTITQYNVQSGGASNLLNNVAPSATSGAPLISQGSSAQPIFGTAVVAGGGTGDTSFTAYSVLTGGTTSTGALQNVSGVGTSGQVLTSNGASALPTWQAVGAGPSPSSTITLVDDFLAYLSDNTYEFISGMTWGKATLMAQVGNLTSANQGLMSNSNSFSSGSEWITSGAFQPGAGVISINWVMKLKNLSTGSIRYSAVNGISNNNTGLPLIGVYFSYSDNVNSGNWVVNCGDGTVTSVNTSVAADTNFHNYGIVINAAATSVSFTIDGVAVGTAITTNIPITQMSLCAFITRILGTVPINAFYLDLVYATQTLSTPR